MTYVIERAGIESVATIVEQRRAMFVDMGHRDEAVLDRMAAEFRPWLKSKMQAERYLAWFAVAPDGAIVGGAGLWLMDWPPHMIARGSVRGNIVNVYTQRAHRGQGVARTLVNAAVAWCRENGISCVILHASPEGRALMNRLAFAGGTRCAFCSKLLSAEVRTFPWYLTRKYHRVIGTSGTSKGGDTLA